MTTVDLPPELKLSIAEHLDPASSFNFAIVCKAHWQLCQPVIEEHSRLFAENETIDTASGGTLVWGRLKDILQHPRHGWYVRDLSLPSGRQNFWDPNVAHDFQVTAQSMRPPDEDVALFTAAARDIESRYPWATDSSHWHSGMEAQISAGSDEPIIVILMHQLRHLKTLRFTDLNLSGAFPTLLRLVALAYGDPLKAPSLPFQHLTIAAVGHWDSELCCHADWCKHLICIPSLRSLAAWAMGNDISEECYELENIPGMTKFPKSNVKELLFTRSQIEARALDNILSGIRALERFSYEGGGALLSDSAYYNPKMVIQALVDQTGHSLEHLTLEHEDLASEIDEDDLNRVSLRGFEKLKTLKCDWRMLWPGSNDEDEDEDALSKCGFYTEDGESEKGFDLLSILPESLEALHLEGSFTDDEWERMANVVDSESALTPNLTQVYIQRAGTRETLRRPEVDDGTTEAGRPLAAIWDNPLRSVLEGQGF